MAKFCGPPLWMAPKMHLLARTSSTIGYLVYKVLLHIDPFEEVFINLGEQLSK